MNDLTSLSRIRVSNFSYAEKVIAMSDSYYQGKYFLVSKSKSKSRNINTVIYKTVFKAETVFSKMEINCTTGKYRKIGEGINSINSINIYSDKGNWITPVYEASHYDVVKFVCKK
ncbi:hypothetical protein HLH17_06825 [Acinetobacter sp. ANC 5380]|uniref:Uncharacterized protein n=1 Tax=Acinetobacter terrae TaxID=2731247 RepID=A0A7Y2REM5_9GAMM|nr:hypothetical protein [Acinetobacter terrae]NNH77386.1 hypothetical protein [Acinetobacter terrae]